MDRKEVKDHQSPHNQVTLLPQLLKNGAMRHARLVVPRPQDRAHRLAQVLRRRLRDARSVWISGQVPTTVHPSASTPFFEDCRTVTTSDAPGPTGSNPLKMLLNPI